MNRGLTNKVDTAINTDWQQSFMIECNIQAMSSVQWLAYLYMLVGAALWVAWSSLLS